MHVVAGVAVERNRGHEHLEHFVLFAVQRHLGAFGFLQSQIVAQAATHRVVQRELQDRADDWLLQ